MSMIWESYGLKRKDQPKVAITGKDLLCALFVIAGVLCVIAGLWIWASQ